MKKNENLDDTLYRDYSFSQSRKKMLKLKYRAFGQPLRMISIDNNLMHDSWDPWGLAEVGREKE